MVWRRFKLKLKDGTGTITYYHQGKEIAVCRASDSGQLIERNKGSIEQGFIVRVL
jgi:hypothetical protein